MLEITLTNLLKKWIIGQDIYYSHVICDNEEEYYNAKYIFIPDEIEEIINLCHHFGGYISSIYFIPRNILEIENNILTDLSFLPCTDKLKCIVISKNVKYIHHRIFSLFINLETVAIHSKKIFIDEYAFSGCKKLKNFRTPPKIKLEAMKNAFENCDSLKIDN